MINVFRLPREYGGAELMAHQLAVNLARGDNLVYMVTCREKDTPISESRGRGYYIYRIARLKIPLIGSSIYYLFILFLAVLLKPDIVLDQGLLGCGLLVRIVIRKPYIVWGRGSDVYGISGFIQRLFVKLMLVKASLVLALSEDMKKCMKQILDREIIVLPNGINVNEIQKTIAQVPEKRFGKKQLLFVGNVRPVKGVEYLMNAMQLVVEEEPEARLVIVGRYPLGFLQKIPKNVREKTTLTGFVDHDKIPMYMKGSDVFVLPSLSEGFPNVLLEAMAAGLPIVATNVGGIPEIISNGENGFLTQPRSSKQLTEKILLLLKDEGLRKRISKNNLLKVRKYDLNRIISRLERYMQHVA